MPSVQPACAPRPAGALCSGRAARRLTWTRFWIARGSRIDIKLLLKRHPDEVDRIFSDIARLVSFADVDRRHPSDLAVRRRRGVCVFGFTLRSGCPLTALDVDIEHV